MVQTSCHCRILENHLKKYFGYDSFRQGQKVIIESILSSRDTLVVMPTGGGKSICYQIPALMIPGCAVVVSPLIALMQDQVLGLKANGYPAETINSFNSEEVNKDIYNRAARGEVKLIYVSPERFITDLEHLSADFPVSFMAVDEAHCISQWGHDFRPVYKDLSKVRTKFPDIPVMALTATADAVTREDITSQLGMKEPFTYIASFNRPNLSLAVIPSPGKNGKLKVIKNFVGRYPNDCGIVYCMTRKTTEEVTESLNAMGVDAVCYHAGLSTVERMDAQSRFINGDVHLIVATVAFGMGIDKSNIRWVIHYNLPANIESYYQEIGRAGRDGLPAETVLFYNYQDIITREYLIPENGQSEVFRNKLERMRDYAEARVCRRRILLSYFNEEVTDNCGNCDVCKNPPQFFQGKIAAQKTMSAIVRAGGSLPVGSIIDILRGNMNSSVRMNRYFELPTFGVGREYTPGVWKSLIGQMIQLGAVESRIDDYGKLSVTNYGRKILYGEEGIDLVMPDFSRFDSRSGARKKVESAAVPLTPAQALFEQLRKVRKNLSIIQGIPEMAIFNDATIEDMVARHPLTLEEFSKVSGVGEIKAVRYWKKFVAVIRKFDGLNQTTKGSTLRETLILYNSGYRTMEIAEIRRMKPATVYGHLAELINEGLITDFRRIITEEQLNLYISNRDKENWFEILDEHLPDGMWRVAKSIAEKAGR